MLLPGSSEYLATSETLGLRRFAQCEIPELYAIESDSFLKRYVGGPVKRDRDEWIQAAASIVRCDVQFALIHIPSKELAGRVTLGHYHRIDKREVQIILARRFVGQGLGREAFQLACSYAFSGLGARTIVAVIDPAHTASLALVTAAGVTESTPVMDTAGNLINRVFELKSAPSSCA